MSSNTSSNFQSSVVNSLYNTIVNNANATNQLASVNLSRNNSSLNSLGAQNNNISNIVNNLIYSRMHNNPSAAAALSNLSMNSQNILPSNSSSHHNRSHHYHNLSSRSSYSNNSLHSSFKSKSVCQLNCRYCQGILCRRGMKAILLADTRVELYSTDAAPIGYVLLYLLYDCSG